MPYTFRNNDIVRYSGSTALTGAAYLQDLKDEFDVLYAEGADRRRMMSVSAHDRLAGSPTRTKALDDFISYAKQHNAVVFMCKDEIAHWIIERGDAPTNPARVFK